MSYSNIYLWVLLYFTENALKESELCRMFFLGGNFVSRLIWTLKSKKPKKLKNLKTFSKKHRYFPALYTDHVEPF